jgi:hypothetical protein
LEPSVAVAAAAVDNWVALESDVAKVRAFEALELESEVLLSLNDRRDAVLLFAKVVVVALLAEKDNI